MTALTKRRDVFVINRLRAALVFKDESGLTASRVSLRSIISISLAGGSPNGLLLNLIDAYIPFFSGSQRELNVAHRTLQKQL